MMRNALPLGEGWLGRANLHEPIDRNGVAADDLAAEFLGQAQRQRSLSARCWAGHYQQRMFVLSACGH
jgi:hypothetical protein